MVEILNEQEMARLVTLIGIQNTATQVDREESEGLNALLDKLLERTEVS